MEDQIRAPIAGVHDRLAAVDDGALSPISRYFASGDSIGVELGNMHSIGVVTANAVFQATNRPVPLQSECLPMRQVCLLRAISRSAATNNPPAQSASFLPNCLSGEFLTTFATRDAPLSRAFHNLHRHIHRYKRRIFSARPSFQSDSQ